MEVARCRTRELQSQVEALQEEVSMQEGSHGNASLLSELELSLHTVGLGTDREQVIIFARTQALSLTHTHTHTDTLSHTHLYSIYTYTHTQILFQVPGPSCSILGLIAIRCSTLVSNPD